MLTAARAYVEAKTGTDRAAATLDYAKKTLVELRAHRRECGAGVTVMRVKKVGSVDYKRVLYLAGVDLEQYRGAAREEIYIKRRRAEHRLILDLHWVVLHGLKA